MTPAPARAELLAGLLARVAAGDERAFQQLYEASASHLFAVALRIMKARDAAEDVMQDAFVRIWDSAAGYAPEKGTPLAWMAAIVRHRAIDALRRRRAHVPLDDAAESALVDPSIDALGSALLGAEARRLMACLDGLGPEQKRCVLLAYFDGLTQEELARRIEAPLGTVKSWLRRSLMHLKECLER